MGKNVGQNHLSGKAIGIALKWNQYVQAPPVALAKVVKGVPGPIIIIIIIIESWARFIIKLFTVEFLKFQTNTHTMIFHLHQQ